MLATILKSPKAVKTTIAIIDTFAKVKEIHRVVHQLQANNALFSINSKLL